MESSSFYAKLAGYANPRMDELLNAERSARTEAERRTIFRQIAELVNEDAVYVPWHYGSDFKGMSPKVKEFVHYQDAMVRYQTISLE